MVILMHSALLFFDDEDLSTAGCNSGTREIGKISSFNYRLLNEKWKRVGH